MIGLLRDQLDKYSGMLAESRSRVGDLELRQTAIDKVVIQAEHALAVSNVMSDDWQRVTRQTAVVADDLLIANAKAEQAELKETNAREALISIEDQLVAVKATLEAEKEQRIKSQVELEGIKRKLYAAIQDKSDALAK